MQLGRINQLKIARQTDFGFYLTDGATEVLLPKKEIPEHAHIGDGLSVFIYKDSEDRPIATTKTPLITLGEVSVLRVSKVTDIGAFLDWGLLKELLLPFKEQIRKLHEDEKIPVVLYIDKSGRLAASMKIYRHLTTTDAYSRNAKVKGIVYEIRKDIGAFVAVDGKYYGMIPKQELYKELKAGDEISARVLRVRPDGKLDLSGRKKAYAQMDADAEHVLEVIRSYDGRLPFTDKTSPEQIQAELSLSKAAFKRAVGRLLTEGQIEIGEDCITTTY